MLFKAIMGSADDHIPGPADDFWYESINQSLTGVRVTALSAMRASACYACVKVLAETIASLPRNIYERQSGDATRPAQGHPLQDVMDLSPNDEQTAFEFWEMSIAFGALYGNSYAVIVPGARGAVDQLKPLRPDYMRIYRASNNTLRFEYTDPLTAKKTIYLADELLRIPGFSFNGVEGIAPIFFATDPIGLALATEAFGAKFFSKDATPAVVLEHPNQLKPEAVKNIKESWLKAHSGLGNAYSVAVLEEGMKVNAIGVKNNEAQFLETRKYQIAEIARYFRIPPHMIGDLERSTNNNIEQQAIDFVKYTIKPWVRRIEQRVNRDLIVASNRFFMKHELDELLMGEMLPRYNAWSSAINAGWLTRNEVRRRENRNPLPGLDEPLKPKNMGDAQEQQRAGEGSQPGNPGRTDSDKSAKAVAAVVSDAFERIVSAEVSGLSALAKKHEGDAFAEKATAFYSKHRTYIEKTLAPSVALCASVGIATNTAALYAQLYTAHRIEWAAETQAPAEDIARWAENRAEQMTQGFLKMEVQNAETVRESA